MNCIKFIATFLIALIIAGPISGVTQMAIAQDINVSNSDEINTSLTFLNENANNTQQTLTDTGTLLSENQSVGEITLAIEENEDEGKVKTRERIYKDNIDEEIISEQTTHPIDIASEKILNDGTKIKFNSDKNMAISKDSLECTIETSAAILQLGDITKSREWIYSGKGKNHDKVSCNQELVIKGDYVCANAGYVKTSLSEYYPYCIYYEPQIKNVTIGDVITSVNTRRLILLDSKTSSVEFEDTLDPLITSATFITSYGDDGTEAFANSIYARPKRQYNNVSKALMYQRLDGNHIDEVYGGVARQDTCLGQLAYGSGYSDGVIGFSLGTNGTEITACDETYWMDGAWLNGSLCSNCGNWRFNGTWEFWAKRDGNTWTDTSGVFRIRADSNNFISLYFGTGEKYKFEIDVNGSLQQNMESNNLYNDSRWHLVALTWDTNTGNFTLYVDGQYEKVIKTGFSGFNNSYSTMQTMINPNFDTEKAFVDEFIVFNYPKTQSELLADYNAFFNFNLSQPAYVVFRPETYTANASSIQLNFSSSANVQGSIRGHSEIPLLENMYDWSWTTIDTMEFKGLYDLETTINQWDDARMSGINNCLNYTFTFRGSPTYNPRCNGNSSEAYSPSGTFIKTDGKWIDRFFEKNTNYMIAAWIYPRGCDGAVIQRFDSSPQLTLDSSSISGECDQFLKLNNKSQYGKYCWSNNGGILLNNWNLYIFFRNSTGYFTTVYNKNYTTGKTGNCGQTSTTANMQENMDNTTYTLGLFGTGVQYRGGNFSGGTIYFINSSDMKLAEKIYNGTYNWTAWTSFQDSGSTHNLAFNSTYIQTKLKWTNVTNVTQYSTSGTSSGAGGSPVNNDFVTISIDKNITTNGSIWANFTVAGNWSYINITINNTWHYNGTTIIFNDTGLLNNTGYFWRVEIRWNSTLWNQTNFTIMTQQTIPQNQTSKPPLADWNDSNKNVQYDFEENNANAQLRDSAANPRNHNGTLTGSIIYTTGLSGSGYAVNYNGTGYHTIANYQDFANMTSFEIDMAIKPSNNATSSTLFSCDGNKIRATLMQGNYIELEVYVNSTYKDLWNYAGGRCYVGNKCYYSLIFNGSVIAIYQNNSLIASLSSGIGSTWPLSSSCKLGYDSGGNIFNGTMDCFSMYANNTLSDTARQGWFQNCTASFFNQTQPSALIVYLPMNETSGLYLKDAIMNDGNNTAKIYDSSNFIMFNDSGRYKLKVNLTRNNNGYPFQASIVNTSSMMLPNSGMSVSSCIAFKMYSINTNSYHTIYRIRDSTGGEIAGLAVKNTTKNISFYSPGGGVTDTSLIITENASYHACTVFDNLNNRCLIYLNGVNLYNYTTCNGDPYGYNITTVYFGGDYAAYMDGLIWNFRYYKNYTLSPSEVYSIYTSDMSNDTSQGGGQSTPTQPNSITCNSGSCNNTFTGSINMQCSGSTDPQSDLITYVLEKGNLIGTGQGYRLAGRYDNTSAVYQTDSYGAPHYFAAVGAWNNTAANYTAWNQLNVCSPAVEPYDRQCDNINTWYMGNWTSSNTCQNTPVQEIYNSGTWSFMWNLDDVYFTGYSDYAYAYFQTFVWSDNSRAVRIFYDKDDTMWLYLNGIKQTLSDGTLCEGAGFDENYVDINLLSGWNKLQFAVADHGGGWDLAYRYTDTSNNSILLNYTSFPPSGNGQSYNYLAIGNHTQGNSYNWDLSGETPGEAYESLRCKAVDLAGSGNYSGYYNQSSALTIGLAPSNQTITPITEYNLAYDQNGNLVTGDGKFRVYNSLNQLTAIYNGTNSSGTLLENYIFDPVEERIAQKTVYLSNGSIKETVYYFSQDYIRVVNSSGSYDYEYVYLNGQLVAQINPDSSKYFMSTDHQGNIVAVTNSSGVVIENTSYDSFGNVLSGGSKSRFSHEGKEFDSVVGDTDFHFRKLLGIVPVFAQPDDRIQNIFDAQNLNRYSFEENTPYGKTDPTGHFAMYIEGSGSLSGGAAEADKSYGIVLTLSYTQGMQIATYQSSGEGVSTPGASLNVNFGYSPFTESPDEFSGESDTYSLGVDTPLVKQGGTLSIPKNGDITKFSLTKTNSVLSSNPFKLTVSASKTTSKTEIIKSASITKPILKLSSNINKAVKKVNTVVICLIFSLSSKKKK